MESTILRNVRFQHLYGTLEVWKNANPIILPGELALVKDDNNRMKIKIGTGMSFIDTAFMYSMDRWTSDYKNTLTAADDANIKPADSTGYNTEDFLQVSGDLLYPINLTTSVRLKDGSKLQAWMDNVKTGNITMTGELKINRPIGGIRNIISVLGDDEYGTSIVFSGGGNTVVASGEAAENRIKSLLNTSSKHLYLASDDAIFLYTKCDKNSPTQSLITFNGTAFYPGSNKTIDLGATSYRWANIYANFIDSDTSINVPQITFKNNTTATVKGISGLLGNDYWRVGGALSDAANQDTGYLEIATADNGNEPIYVRQYTGNFTTIARTLTLLDASGNSLFPGNISEKGSTLENKYLQRSGALAMTGALDMGAHHSVTFRPAISGHSAVGGVFKNSDDSRFGGFGSYNMDGVGTYLYFGFGENPWNPTSGMTIAPAWIKFNNKKIWWEDNDGANSGLDADLLDGKHASAFSLTSHTHSYAGSASVGGPANSALKFQTARKIGNASFDGTADITIAQMGVSPVAGSTSLSQLASTIKLGDGNAATILQDGATYHQKIEIVDDSTAGTDVFRFSQSEDSGTTWKTLFSILDNGTIKANQFTGNSATATKLQTARKIGDANFDGTANITVQQIGAAPTVHDHSNLIAVASTKQTTVDEVNKYTKISTMQITKQYGYITNVYECITGAHVESKADSIKLILWIKQQAALGGDPIIDLAIMRNNAAKVEFFVTIDEKTSSYTQVSLYVKVNSAHTSMSIFEISSIKTDATIEYFDRQQYIASLPNGLTVISSIDITGNHKHTKSQITDFPTSLKNPNALTISLNGTSQGAYDGSAAKSINITAVSVGARPVGATLLDSNADLNTIINEGEYYCTGGNSITHKPDVSAFGLRVQRSAAGYITQIVYASNDISNSIFRDKIFIRSYRSGDGTTDWTNWSMLYSTKYKPTAVDVGALPINGGILTGSLGLKLISNPTGGSARSLYFVNHSDSETVGGIGVYCSQDDFKYVYLGVGPESWRETNSLSISATEIKFHGYTVWHAGNDGAGSGLDADLLDGLQASAFARATHTHTKSQITDFPTSLKNPTALTISLNGTSQGAYDGSAAKSINITPASIGAALATHTHDYLPSSGGTVEGDLLLRKGYRVHDCNGASGTAGYILFAQLQIKDAYQNSPIEMELVQRGRPKPSVISIQFANSDFTNPDLFSFTRYGGSCETYIHRISDGVWNLYILKTEAYDNVSVTRLSAGEYNKIKIVWKNELVQAVPSGAVKATFQLSASNLSTKRKIGNADFDGTANITAAQMGVAPANLVYKNVTIAVSAWNATTKIYEYANAAITANHIPQVFFSTASLDAAGRAGIMVYTETGKLVVKCTVVPTVALVMETILLTPV